MPTARRPRTDAVHRATLARIELRARGAQQASDLAGFFKKHIKNLIGPLAWLDHIYWCRVVEVERIAGAFLTGRCRVTGFFSGTRRAVEVWAIYGDEKTKPPKDNSVHALYWPSKAQFGPNPTPWIELEQDAEPWLYFTRHTETRFTGGSSTTEHAYRIPWPPPNYERDGVGAVREWERKMEDLGQLPWVIPGFRLSFGSPWGYNRVTNHVYYLSEALGIRWAAWKDAGAPLIPGRATLPAQSGRMPDTGYISSGPGQLVSWKILRGADLSSDIEPAPAGGNPDSVQGLGPVSVNVIEGVVARYSTSNANTYLDYYRHAACRVSRVGGLDSPWQTPGLIQDIAHIQTKVFASPGDPPGGASGMVGWGSVDRIEALNAHMGSSSYMVRAEEAGRGFQEGQRVSWWQAHDYEPDPPAHDPWHNSAASFQSAYLAPPGPVRTLRLFYAINGQDLVYFPTDGQPARNVVYHNPVFVCPQAEGEVIIYASFMVQEDFAGRQGYTEQAARHVAGKWTRTGGWKVIPGVSDIISASRDGTFLIGRKNEFGGNLAIHAQSHPGAGGTGWVMSHDAGDKWETMPRLPGLTLIEWSDDPRGRGGLLSPPAMAILEIES